MLKIAKKTRLTAADILKTASHFFGSRGEGLTETSRNPCCISFDGGGGFVSVSIREVEDRREVDVETMEFDHQARQFLNQL